MCPAMPEKGLPGRWACESCITYDSAGHLVCAEHGQPVVNAGSLWARTISKSQSRSLCPYGCPGIADRHHHCPRLRARAGKIVFRGNGLFDTLKHCEAHGTDLKLLGESGSIVRMRTAGRNCTPNRLDILLSSPTVASVARVSFTYPGGVAHRYALVMPGQSNSDPAPLYPKGDEFHNCSSATIKMIDESVHRNGNWTPFKRGKHQAIGVHHLQAIKSSACARARWAGLLGGNATAVAPADGAENINPKQFGTFKPVPAAYTRHQTAGFICAHCTTLHRTLAHYVATCAPEHPEIL